MVFKPGQSGNPSGSRNERIWRQALLMALKRPKDERTKIENMPLIDQLAEKQIAIGLMGDNSAIRDIADRLDGKPAQTTIVQGDEDGGPVHTVNEIRRTIVDPKDTEKSD